MHDHVSPSWRGVLAAQPSLFCRWGDEARSGQLTYTESGRESEPEKGPLSASEGEEKE